MRLHRFIGNFDLEKDTLAISDTELINQWRNVLRLKTGDELILCDGAGREAHAVIMASDKKELRLAIKESEKPEREARKKATLFCALLKRENFELVCQKATELGITTIVPLLTERTVKTGLNRERLEKIIREAAEQSGRTILPTLAEPMTFPEAINSVDPKESMLFDLGGGPLNQKSSAVNFFVGPEGGFSTEEAALSRERGLSIVSLGSLTLRAETAAIVASYYAVND